MNEIYLVRHGEAYSNLKNDESDQNVGDSLTDQGKQQASDFATNFKYDNNLLIVSSDLARAQQTAQALIDHTLNRIMKNGQTLMNFTIYRVRYLILKKM